MPEVKCKSFEWVFNRYAFYMVLTHKGISVFVTCTVKPVLGALVVLDFFVKKTDCAISDQFYRVDCDLFDPFLFSSPFNR